MTREGELVQRLTTRQRQINAAEAGQVTDMLEYVDLARAAGQRLGGADMARLEASAAIHELSLVLMMPPKTVQDRVCAARRIRAQLPAVWAAWSSGELSAYKVSRIDAQALRLTFPASVVDLDEQVVAVAAGKTATQLGSWLARFVERTEPGQAHRRCRRAAADRRVYVQPDGDGMAWINAFVPAMRAATIDARLDQEARSLPASDPRTTDQARADAFTDLLLGTDGGRTTGTTIGVIVPVQSLMNLSDTPGETADRSASVPATLIRDEAVRPGTLFWRLLTDPVGNLLDATYVGRHAPDKLGTAVRLRDGTSVFPTASVPADRTDLDHTDAWPGPTRAANLGSLHRRAHVLKTHGLLHLRQPRSGVFEWTTRTGHTHIHRADPLPVQPWDSGEPWFDPVLVTAETLLPEILLTRGDDHGSPPRDPLPDCEWRALLDAA